ncbi:MAG: carotenoid oxygenase family protein [Nannocystaceae bacterium]|nr:carotenoid oxygenase family protein [bacterium]
MSSLPITARHGKALNPSGVRPTDAPAWIDEVDNPYLHGLFAPVSTEVTADALPVLEGELPRDLWGGYFRNGPNSVHAPKNRYHWFDGDGMVHGIWFEDGKARYANRWVETAGMKMESEAQAPIWPGVLGPFDFSAPLGPIKDTANTDLIEVNGRLLALWYESGKPYVLDPKTLQTRGVEDFGGQLSFPLSAHSKTDPATGDFIFFSYGDRPPYMRYGVLTASGELHHVEIDLPGPRRPHDIGVTPRYSILHDFPVFFDPELFAKKGKRVPLFHPDVPTRYGIIPRLGTNDDVRWFECEPCYMLHVVNCWEDGDWVVMIGCRTTDPTLRPDRADGPIAAMLSGLKLQANLYRWRFNMVTGAVEEGPLDDANAEFPMIRPSVIGQENRWAYLQRIPFEIPATFEGLMKYDLRSGAFTEYAYGQGVYGSEAPFAPRAGGAADDAEDDGYLVSFVTDTTDWSSACVVFDAKDVAAGPLAKVALPQRVPAGFHATWIDGATLDAAAS